MAEHTPALLQTLRDVLSDRPANAPAESTPSLAAQVECTICNEPLREHRLLPCGHTFCLRCLEHWVNNRGWHNTINCPLDRQQSVLPENGVRGLPMNFALAGVIEKISPPDGATALAYADHVEVIYGDCSQCDIHSRVQTCSHCSRNLCRSCRSLHHDEVRFKLRKWSYDLRKTTSTSLSAGRSESMAEEDQQHVASVKQQISQFSESLMDKVNKLIIDRKNILFSKVEVLSQNLHCQRAAELLQQESLQRTAGECIEILEKLCDDSMASPLQDGLDKIEKDTSVILKEIQSYGCSEVHGVQKLEFILPDRETERQAFKQVSDLLKDDLVMEKRSQALDLPEAPPAAVAAGDMAAMHPISMPVQESPGDSTLHDEPIQGQRPLWAERSHPDITWRELGYGNGREDGYFNTPSGILVSHATGEIFVSDRYNNRIQVFSMDGAFKCIWSGGLGQVVGLDQTPDGLLVAIDHGNSCVMLYAKNKVISRFGKKGARPGTVKNPLGVAVDQVTGNIYVCDAGNNRVEVFTKAGDFITLFGGPETRLPYANDILIAGSKVIVSCWSSNKVELFTKEGQSLMTLQGEDIVHPMGMAANANGTELYVCCDPDIMVYSLTPEVCFKKRIASPVDGERTTWLSMLTPDNLLVCVEHEHQVFRVSLS